MVNATAPSFVNFDWSGINSVSFHSFGGTNHGYNGGGTHFAMDNVSARNAPVVPEPGEYAFAAFAGASVLGLVVRARRRRTSVTPQAA